MYIAAVCIFLIPTLFVVLAWKRWSKIHPNLLVPKWRFHCLTACLIVASVAIPTGLSESFAWLHAGGNPHGMGTPGWNLGAVAHSFPLCRAHQRGARLIS
jgi:hypothetical protein